MTIPSGGVLHHASPAPKPILSRRERQLRGYGKRRDEKSCFPSIGLYIPQLLLRRAPLALHMLRKTLACLEWKNTKAGRTISVSAHVQIPLVGGTVAADIQ